MLDLTQVWLAECGRCANEDWSDYEDEELAHVELRSKGWTRGDRTYCPQCSAETK